jgi:hypothetical protein
MTTTLPIDRGDPSVERTARWLRLAAAALVVFTAVALLAGCTAPPRMVETHSTASTVRKLGYSGVTSSQVKCWEREPATTEGQSTTRYSSCEVADQAALVIEVDVTAKSSTATAVVTVVRSSFVAGQWAERTDRARCEWSMSGSAWSMASCTSPQLVAS